MIQKETQIKYGKTKETNFIADQWNHGQKKIIKKFNT